MSAAPANTYIAGLPDPEFYRLALAVEAEWWHRWALKHGASASTTDRIQAVLTRIAAVLHDHPEEGNHP